MLHLVKHRLPPLWDGLKVTWSEWEESPPMFICPPPKPQPCPECGTLDRPTTSQGTVTPELGTMTESTKPKMGRFGRIVHIPTMVPAWPLISLSAQRCKCGHTDVWDMRTNEWWTLGPEDYTDAGSTVSDMLW